MIVLSFFSPLLSFIRFCYYALLYIIGFPWKYIIENHSISISSSPPHPSLFSSLKNHTDKEYMIKSIMLSSPLELTLIKMFASSIKAKNALDIGCFTGYSALYLYFSLYSRSSSDPPSVLTIDNDQTRIAEAEKFFNQIDPKKSVIKTIVGDALTVLKKLETEEYAKELYYWNQLIHNNNNNNNNNKQEKNDHDNDDDHQIDYSNDFYRFVGSHGQPPFDIIYLDADKVHYPLYYQLLLDKHYLSPNGYLFIDNALLFTAFTAPWPKFFGGNNAEGIMNLNQLIKNDKRVEVVLLPFRDGLAIIKWSLSHLQSCSICLKRSYHDHDNNINKNNHHSSVHRSMNGKYNNNINNKKNIRSLNGTNNDHDHVNSVSLNGDMIPFAYRSSSSAAFIH